MRLPGHQVASLSKTSDRRSVLDACVLLACLVAVIGVAHVVHHWAMYALAVVAIGGLQNRMLVHAHEAWHRKAFSSVALNQFVGAWIYSYPLGVPFLSDQSRHLAHHRKLGSAEDPDWRDYEREGFRAGASPWGYLIAQLLGMKVWLRISQALNEPIARDPARAVAHKEHVGIVLWQVALLALFATTGRWWEYLLLWALPLATVTSFIIAFRAYVEHAHADVGASAHDRLYDFSAGLFTRAFVSPLFFHWHALHHAYPSVPYARLPELQRELRDAGVDYPHRDRRGYLASLREVIDEMRRTPLQKTS